jgi:pimeloyl-ACP methyl ester carboxylesterase
MTIAKARRDGIEIAYETFGPPGNPLLLVMGVGAQMLYWHDEFCAALAARRFWVARFDNPDAGLSSHLSLAGVPNQLKMLRRPAEAAVYRLEDMADDAMAVLDALRWRAAHVVGRSLGGMIAQTLAIRHASRVLSLTSISSIPSARIRRATLGMALRLLIANPPRCETGPQAPPRRRPSTWCAATRSSAHPAIRWTRRGCARSAGGCTNEVVSTPPAGSGRTPPPSPAAIVSRPWPPSVCPRSSWTARTTD